MNLRVISIFVLAVLAAPSYSYGEGLAFYLVKESAQATNASTTLELENTPIFTQTDIISYSLTNQSMMLTKSGMKKLNSVGIGSSFTACVNKKPIYSGKIWSPVRDAGCREIVLMVPPDGSAKVDLLAGYPDRSFFTGDDQRSNKSIVDALRASGKIR